jgi:hypothetical protein
MGMKLTHIAPALALCCTVSVFAVQADTAPEKDGASLVEEGLMLLFREMLDEMEPALDELQSMGDELGPKLLELIDIIGDLNEYHAPEKLPNGDILIRRISPLKEGEIDL